MNYKLLPILTFAVLGLFSCKKYTDPVSKVDPRLVQLYCNDPYAVNYNWNFPGTPDSTTCFYPTDVFQGTYELSDSVYFDSSGLFISANTFYITIRKHSKTKMAILGFCPWGDSIRLTASANYSATLDTLVGDSTTLNRGQMICGLPDTLSGSITKDQLNDSIIYFSLHVSSDTGIATNHIGRAKLKFKK